MGLFDEVHARSLRDPEGFWGEAAEAIEWERRWDRVLDDSDAPHYRWFPGGRLNTCHNALDRQVAAGRGEQLALIYDSPVTGSVQRFTYRELRGRVAEVTGAPKKRGGSVAHREVIYLQMVV